MGYSLDIYKKIGERQTLPQRWNDLSDKERAKTTFNEWKAKENDKKVLASGYGVNKMMDISYKKGFNKDNSRLWVKDTSDFNSEWKIFKK